jgi:hypothetical protein
METIYKRYGVLKNEDTILKEAYYEFVEMAEDSDGISEEMLNCNGIESAIYLINDYSEKKLSIIEKPILHSFNQFDDGDSFFNFMNDTNIDFLVNDFKIGTVENNFQGTYSIFFENQSDLDTVLELLKTELV